MVATIYGAEKDVYLVGTQQLYDLGQKLETPSGEIFRFTEMGGTVGIANNLYQGEVPTPNWVTQALTTAMAVGDTTITAADGGTAAVADELAGGTVIAEETADLGHIYRIKSNNATSGNETVLTLEDGVTVVIAVAVAANNVTTMIVNLFKDVVISPAGINTAANVGVQRRIIAANGFGWTQTRGVASCLFDTDASEGALLLGNGMRAATDVVGAVTLHAEAAGDIDSMSVGYALVSAPTQDFGHIFLLLE